MAASPRPFPTSGPLQYFIGGLRIRISVILTELQEKKKTVSQHQKLFEMRGIRLGVCVK